MINLKRILFPTDFSVSADRARRFAQQLADRFGAELHLLHVIQDLSLHVPEFAMGLSFPGFVDATAEQRRTTHSQAMSTLEAGIEAGWRQQHRVEFATRFGTPFLEIIRYAKAHDIDLIVIGSHGRTGLAHVLLGSVAERVVNKAPCPVLTVRHQSSKDDHGESAGRPFGVHPLPVG